MSDIEEPAETISEALLRAGKELLDASKQTLQDLDEMLAGDEPEPEPEAI